MRLVDRARPDAIISTFAPIIGRPCARYSRKILMPAHKGEPPGVERPRPSARDANWSSNGRVVGETSDDVRATSPRRNERFRRPFVNVRKDNAD